ncbi:LytTR family DNA-binding domain-containing protein [Hyphococcus sp.]|uniref:LytTR family DNA-binding domain-containing protein n=1 Tax=Hyphococcus sp. TaxID=2038636 RepID=UPI00208D652F|nr:MAG: hypothetical protein DHS20C04_27150 [Marinicaulis sp.]
MTEVPAPLESPQRADARADRLTFIWMAGFFIAFLIVDILSSLTEVARHQLDADPAKVAIYEISSVFVILILYWVIARAVTLATPGQHSWRYVLAVHAAAMVVFSTVHIGAMVALRKLAFMIAYDYPYIFTDNPVRDFIYEFRKDALTYVLIAFFITFGRQLALQRREIAAAHEDARKTNRLTLKCGGRSVFVDAGKVIWVKSASNYVELNAGAETHLARTTLSAIEDQLIGAGVKAVRVHRSWVINAGQIEKIEPTGEGDVKIELKDGTIVPGSRRYRDRLAKIS